MSVRDAGTGVQNPCSPSPESMFTIPGIRARWNGCSPSAICVHDAPAANGRRFRDRPNERARMHRRLPTTARSYGHELRWGWSGRWLVLQSHVHGDRSRFDGVLVRDDLATGLLAMPRLAARSVARGRPRDGASALARRSQLFVERIPNVAGHREAIGEVLGNEGA